MKKESILMAVLMSVCIYLDVVLKLVYDLTLEYNASPDGWWLLCLVVIFVLYLLCIFYESLILNIVTYITGFIPLIYFIVYLCVMDPNNGYSDWPLTVTYIVSELILFIPIYCLELKKIYLICKSRILI